MAGGLGHDTHVQTTGHVHGYMWNTELNTDLI